MRGELNLPVLQVIAPAEPTTDTTELAAVVQVGARPARGGSGLVTGEERDAAPGTDNPNPSSEGGGDPSEAAGGV